MRSDRDMPDERLALQRLYHWEATAPGRVVMTQPLGGGPLRDYTWAQAMDEARRVAEHLRALALPAGSRIALLSKNCAHWLMADFAIWMAGHVSVPLYPTLTAASVRRILDHAAADVLFVGKLDAWEAMRPGVPAHVMRIHLPLGPAADGEARGWDDIVRRTPPLSGRPVRPGDELATIIYTSGTTGEPKGVMHSFGTLAWALDAAMRRVELDRDTRVLSYLPLAHVAERMLVEHGLLATSMHIHFAESLDTFLSDLRRARPTAFFSVPRLWLKFRQGVETRLPPRRLDRLLRLPVIGRLVARRLLAGLGLDRCRIASSGAAPMPAELHAWWSRLGLDIVEAYGMTENCAVSHGTRPGAPCRGSVGKPYDGVRARIDSDTGEVQMISGGLMLGYYRAPELTRRARTADGWLRTGDRGELAADGELRLTGRVTELFKTSKGKFVAPAPIEDRLAGGGASIEACVVTGANLPRPLALVMLEPQALARSGGDEVERDAVERALAERLGAVNAQLDPHERLECIVVVDDAWTVDNGFVTPTLKVRRDRIDAAYGPMLERWSQARMPVVWQRAERPAATPDRSGSSGS